MMSTSLNVGLAFLAGVLSFLSPCVLPLIPSYISLIAGTSLQDLKDNRASRRNGVLNTVFFIVGFSIVFAALGIVLTSTFSLLSNATQVINVIAGLIVIVLGLNFIFDFWKVLNVEKRFHLNRKPSSRLGSLLFGMAFGAGWSPCIGPILSSILLLAGTSGKLVQALSLLLVYSLGLGTPFLITGLFFSFALRQMDRLKRHLRAIKIISGIFLVLIGILILAGRLQRFNTLLFSFAYSIQIWEESNPTAARIIFGSIFLVTGLTIGFFYLRRIVKIRRIMRDSRNATYLTSKPESDPKDKAHPPEGLKLEKPGTLRPVRIFFIVLFSAASLLSFTGAINFSKILTGWFNFQGL